MTYFVKSPEKYRRQSKRRTYGPEPAVKTRPIWSFDNEADAVAFAKTFNACYVDVWCEGKVIFRNYSIERPVWVSEPEALVIRENNKQWSPIYTEQKACTNSK